MAQRLRRVPRLGVPWGRAARGGEEGHAQDLGVDVERRRRRGAADASGALPARLPMASLSMVQGGARRGLWGPHRALGDVALADGEGGGADRGGATEPLARVLVSEVQINGLGGNAELEAAVARAVRIKAGFAYTEKDVQEDVDRVYATGWFKVVSPQPDDTRDGVRLTLTCIPNEVLKGVRVTGAEALPARVVQEAFAPCYGKPLNLARFNAGMEEINAWYRDHGYDGQIVSVAEAGFSFDGDLDDLDNVGAAAEGEAEGVLELNVLEAKVNSVGFQFVGTESGEPQPEGATKVESLRRWMGVKPGQVLNVFQARADMHALAALGIFEDVGMHPAPVPEKPGHVDVVVTLVEKRTGGFNVGGGLSATSVAKGTPMGLMGNMSWKQANLFGKGQKLSVSVDLGQTESIFKINHTDPWLWGDKHRTSRMININKARSQAMIFDGPEEEPGKIDRLTTEIEYSRPLTASGLSGSISASMQRVGVRKHDGSVLTEDHYGNRVTFSGTADDDVLMAKVELAFSGRGPGRNTRRAPPLFCAARRTAHVSVEQGVPLLPSWLQLTRVRGGASTAFGLPGWRGSGLQVIAKGGTVAGDLPPHEAFPMGGTNSVRGYEEGALGSARTFAETSAELTLPLGIGPATSPIGAALFADWASDFGSGATVPGNPGGMRNKPGSGYGFGCGLRLPSPLGPLRLDMAFNKDRVRRFHFGIGQR